MMYYVEENGALSPDKQLTDDNIPENKYYSQVGKIINWLFDKYGVDKINQLYCKEKQALKKRFKEVLSTDFEAIEKEYLKY